MVVAPPEEDPDVAVPEDGVAVESLERMWWRWWVLDEVAPVAVVPAGSVAPAALVVDDVSAPAPAADGDDAPGEVVVAAPL